MRYHHLIIDVSSRVAASLKAIKESRQLLNSITEVERARMSRERDDAPLRPLSTRQRAKLTPNECGSH
jgi:hypothetical protein